MSIIPTNIGSETKKLLLICVASGLIFALSATTASAAYVEILDLYIYSKDNVNWSHTYDHSADPATSATLTVVADDVDGPSSGSDGEQDEVWVTVGTDQYYLGLLNDMGYYTNWQYHPGPGNPAYPDAITTTVFDLDTSWLNGLPVEVKVEPSWGIEIETSTLTVIPEPGTVLLFGFGGLVLLRKRRK